MNTTLSTYEALKPHQCPYIKPETYSKYSNSSTSLNMHNNPNFRKQSKPTKQTKQSKQSKQSEILTSDFSDEITNQLKPTASFKMKSQFKRLLARELDANKRALLKQAFIQAQLSAEQKVKND